MPNPQNHQTQIRHYPIMKIRESWNFQFHPPIHKINHSASPAYRPLSYHTHPHLTCGTSHQPSPSTKGCSHHHNHQQAKQLSNDTCYPSTPPSPSRTNHGTQHFAKRKESSAEKQKPHHASSFAKPDIGTGFFKPRTHEFHGLHGVHQPCRLLRLTFSCFSPANMCVEISLAGKRIQT